MAITKYKPRNSDLLWVLLLSVPVLFINVQKSSDWGGDFAMYINEAVNIAHFHAVSDTHYIYNENAHMLGPPLYPVGFPLLLAPVIAFAGNNMATLIVYMSFILVALTIVFQLFFRQYFSKTVSVVLVLFLVYAPWTLQFKNEILADIPFTLFFILTLILYFKKVPDWITGLVMGFTLLIKTAGLVLPAAFVLFFLYQTIATPVKLKVQAKRLLVPVGYALLFSLLVNKVVFNIPAGIGLYSGNFSLYHLWHNILTNAALYIEIFQSFFDRNLHDYRFLVLITQSVLLTLAIIGLINSKKNLLLFVFLTYILLLLVYPYHSSGFRFLLPVMPLLLMYAVYGFKSIQWNFTVGKNLLFVVLSLLLLGQSVPQILKLAKRPVKILVGPQEKVSQETFAYIREHISEKDTILFTKPRVLALYTGRNGFCNESADSTVAIEQLLKEKHIRYLLTNKNLTNSALDKFLKEKGNVLSPVYENEKFKLYDFSQ